MTLERFQQISDRYADLKVVIVGDFCLDRYLEIDPSRQEISIETGLPVYNVVRVRSQPGAAGTVLNNVSALGVRHIIPIGWCGEDGEGYELKRTLSQVPGVHLDSFLVTPMRRTFTYCKPMMMEPNQPLRELNRLDSKNWDATPLALQEQISQALLSVIDQIDALIILDQVDLAETGVVTSLVLETVSCIVKSHPKLRILGDSRRGLAGWPGITFKMNATELGVLMKTPENLSLEAIQKSACDLAVKNQREVIVTLAERGLLIATPQKEMIHVPSVPVRGLIDVVGAGDSVTANMTLALASGASYQEALEIASAASSVVIHKLGTTGTANQTEIAEILQKAGK